MTPPPVAVSLILCEQVIVDRESGNPAPINLFAEWRVDSFSSDDLGGEEKTWLPGKPKDPPPSSS
jgi:hypothetical protein